MHRYIYTYMCIIWYTYICTHTHTWIEYHHMLEPSTRVCNLCACAFMNQSSYPHIPTAGGREIGSSKSVPRSYPQAEEWAGCPLQVSLTIYLSIHPSIYPRSVAQHTHEILFTKFCWKRHKSHEFTANHATHAGTHTLTLAWCTCT